MKEEYTIKDFDLSLNMDIRQKASMFQKYIDQLTQQRHRSYWIEALTGIKETMEINDLPSGKPKNVISFVANDYLGMSQREEVVQAAIQGLQLYGTGACAAQPIGGYLHIHRLLEDKISSFLNTEDAMLFSSGFGTNVGILNALLGKNDIALIDSCVHMSVLDGLKNTNTKNIGHNNLEYLEIVLKREKNKFVNKLVIIDGVYSQDGDIAPIPEIIGLCKKYDALLMVDDAHGIGVFGKNGKGTIEHFNKLGEVDIITGTFSKSLGSVGGFVAGSKQLIQYLRYYTNSVVFSAAPAPSVISSVLKALDLITTKPEIRNDLWKNVTYLRSQLTNEGFDIGKSVSPIFPIMIRDDYKVKEVVRLLLEENIYAVGIIYPGVRSKEARVRISIQATHKKEHLDKLVNALNLIDRKIKLR